MLSILKNISIEQVAKVVLSALVIIGLDYLISTKAYNKGVKEERARIEQASAEKHRESLEVTKRQEEVLVNGIELRESDYAKIQEDVERTLRELDARVAPVTGVLTSANETPPAAPSSAPVTVLPSVRAVLPTTVLGINDGSDLRSQIEINAIWKAYCLESNHPLCKSFKN